LAETQVWLQHIQCLQYNLLTTNSTSINLSSIQTDTNLGIASVLALSELFLDGRFEWTKTVEIISIGRGLGRRTITVGVPVPQSVGVDGGARATGNLLPVIPKNSME
jgi:hypothetical protein